MMAWTIKKYTFVFACFILAVAHVGRVEGDPTAAEPVASTDGAAAASTTTASTTTASTNTTTKPTEAGAGATAAPVTLPPDWSLPQTFVRTTDTWRVLDQGDRAGEEAYDPELLGFAERDPLAAEEKFPGKWIVKTEQPPSGVHHCKNELRLAAYEYGIRSVDDAVEKLGCTSKDKIAYIPVFVAYPKTVPRDPAAKVFPIPVAPFTKDNLFPKGSQSILCELYNPDHPGSASGSYLSLGVVALIALVSLISF